MQTATPITNKFLQNIQEHSKEQLIEDIHASLEYLHEYYPETWLEIYSTMLDIRDGKDTLTAWIEREKDAQS